MYKTTFIALAIAAIALPAQAVTVTQWNFNSKTLTPSTGTGSLSLIGGITMDAAYGNGDANGGSSDPKSGSDFGLQTLNYSAPGKTNKSSGIALNISTKGFTDLVFSYDLRHSNTSSRYEQVQYSLDGTTFIDIATFDGNKGDTWFNKRSVNLSAIAGAANNDKFALRVVSAFAPGGNQYLASNSGSGYAATGTWRFDMVTLSGNVAAVPEPESYALMLAGLGVTAFIARRRKQA